MIHDAFATPAIWYPGQEPQEFEYELERMMLRSKYTQQWLDGEMSTADYMDMLHYLGVDPVQSAADWAAGIVYL